MYLFITQRGKVVGCRNHLSMFMQFLASALGPIRICTYDLAAP